MYAGATVGVVVTAYDEAAFVGDVIETVPRFVDRIYVVDDASPDDCWTVIRRSAASINRSGSDPRHVVPLQHDENQGYGGAVKTGYRRALEDGMDVVAVMNGDAQMDPEILHHIIHPVVSGGADYAKGNRLLSRPDRDGMSTFRFVGNVLLSGLSKFATGYWQISDPQNGYTAIGARTLERIDLDRCTDEYGFLNDILVELNARECRVADVPMRARYGDEESSIRTDRFVRRVSVLLLRNFLRRLTSRYVVRELHPAALYYAIGIAGAIGSALAVLANPRRGLSTAGTLGLLGSLALTMGIERDAAANDDLQELVDREALPAAPEPVESPPAPRATVAPADAE